MDVKRREAHFANSAIAVEYEGERAAAIVEFLFRHIAEAGPTEPHTTYRVLPQIAPQLAPQLAPQAASLVLRRADVTLYRGSADAECADLLMGDSTHALAACSHGGLLFHAAGLAWQGRGLLLPGRIASGKTTLSAWLATRGFDFLSDELIFIPSGTNTLHALTRPLNVKAPARSVLRPYFDFDHHAAQLLSTPRGDLTPIDLLRPQNELSTSEIKTIILPHYVPEAAFKLETLSPGRAAFTLVDTVVNARNLPDHGLPELARLARSLPVRQLVYSNFAQIVDQLDAFK
jgi:hypothetical protein